MESARHFMNIAVSEAFLLTALGEDATMLYANVSAAFRNEETREIPRAGYGESDSVALRTCPIPAPGRTHLAAMVPELLGRVLVDMERPVRRHLAAGEKVRLHVVAPPADAARSRSLSSSLQLDWLRRHSEALSRVACTTGDTQSATADLIDCCASLVAGDCDAAYFGGMDSLISPATFDELFEQGRIPRDPAAGAVSPGEGVAFIGLRRIGESDTTAVRLTAAAAAPVESESVSARAGALARSLTHAVSAPGGERIHITDVIHDLQGESARVREWMLAQDRAWPNRLPESLRQAVQDGKLAEAANPDEITVRVTGIAATLGCLGAASLPVSLAVGLGKLHCARAFRSFGCPMATELLVVDAASSRSRGAVRLSLAEHTEET